MNVERRDLAEADLRQPDDSQSVVELTQTFGSRAIAAGRGVVAFGRANSGPICLTLTLVGIVISATVFSVLGVRNHRNFGTWAYDMAIYDQAFWLISQGGDTFMSVRGLDVWGHHVNLIAYAFAPFYRLGAGPEFLYVVQNVSIALRCAPRVPDRQGALRQAVDGPRLRRRLPALRARPMGRLDQLPP